MTPQSPLQPGDRRPLILAVTTNMQDALKLLLAEKADLGVKDVRICSLFLTFYTLTFAAICATQISPLPLYAADLALSLFLVSLSAIQGYKCKHTNTTGLSHIQLMYAHVSTPSSPTECELVRVGFGGSAPFCSAILFVQTEHFGSLLSYVRVRAPSLSVLWDTQCVPWDTQ